MPIVVMKPGQAAHKVSQTPIAHEEQLQKYIHANPDTIPLDEIREDIRLCVLAREFPTSTGSIDALAVDDEGAIYVIETKLYKNPDKRLVVAQVLDYGAALWNDYRDYAQMEPVLEKTVTQKSGQSLSLKLKELFNMNDDEFIVLLERFKENLRLGRFTFIILMDHLHDQLKALLNFINQNSRFSILGCEMEFYKYNDLDILIPKLYGIETRAVGSFSQDLSIRKKWDEPMFFADANARLSSLAQQSVRRLFEFSKRSADRLTWGTGPARGSFSPKYESLSRKSVITVFSDGALQINFGWLNDTESTLVFRKKLKENLAQKAGLKFPSNYDEKFPAFKINQWNDKTSEIIEALDELIKETLDKVDKENDY